MRSPSESSARWPRRVTVLGSTGSIGRAACDVIAALPDRLHALALAARSRVDLLADQAVAFQPAVVALTDAARAPEFRSMVGDRWRGRLLLGPEGLEEAASLPDADVVLNGLVGASGLKPSWLALKAGRPLALANKESLVVAGEFLMREAERWGGRLLPVDSEHSGLFQCLDGYAAESIARVILTASGGPFRTRSLDTFDAITPEEALQHPTWKMGPRITVDSASLLNKGFEVLEARWLFDLEPARIEVWIHPQSIVHGLVEWVDGSTTAQLSVPDMRIPIQFALCHPHRLPGPTPRCDLAAAGRLDFSTPEPERYPCLGLARRALLEGGSAPAVLNAADEVFVEAFLERRIRFPEISRYLERVLDQRPEAAADSLEAVLEADRWARARAIQVLKAGR